MLPEALIDMHLFQSFNLSARYQHASVLMDLASRQVL